MNGLPSKQATTSHFVNRAERLDRPADAVIFETARAPTKDHAETPRSRIVLYVNAWPGRNTGCQAWVGLQEATKDTRPSPYGSSEHWVSEHELPREWACV